MFIANKKHQQKPLFSSVSMLPKKQFKRLQESWAETFYEEVFSRIEEENFAILYSDKYSRPNVPVNVLLGLEILKDGNGWTDEEMYNHFSYNVQVRYALGLHSLDEGHFELRTTYNFRKRLVQHMQETGENLLEVCFEQVTDEQMAVYEVQGKIQRVDSKQIASNIRETTRLRLLVEVIQRAYRMLDVVDKLAYHEKFAPYIKEKSGRYIYRLKGEKHQSHIEQIGGVMAELLPELSSKYATDTGYQMLERVFGEHFKQTEGVEGEQGAKTVTVKEGKELSADSLQSPDDWEASFRRKQDESYVGYVTNVTETVDPDGGLQLITKIQTAPNTAEDASLLNEALPDLVERTGVETVYNDGAYASPELDETCQQLGVTQHPTAIRGCDPNPDTPALANFDIEIDADGLPEQMTCPHGHPVDLAPTRTEGRFVARVAESVCPLCAAHDKRQLVNPAPACLSLYFSLPQLAIALRRQRMLALRASGRNPRAAVESTIHEVTCRLEHGRLRVRGLCRVSMTMAASAMMTNARRIWRFNQAKVAQMAETTRNQPETDVFAPVPPLFSRLAAFWCPSMLEWRSRLFHVGLPLAF